MPPPSIAPLIPTQKDLDEAAAAHKKLLLAAVALLAAVRVAPRFPETTAKVTHFFTGFEIKPGAGVKIKPTSTLLLAPQPIGLVPPRFYTLPPEFGDPLVHYRAVTGRDGGREQNAKQRDERLSRELMRELVVMQENFERFSEAELLKSVEFFRAEDSMFGEVPNNTLKPKFLRALALLEAERRGLIPRPAVDATQLAVAPKRDGTSMGFVDAAEVAAAFGDLANAVLFADQFASVNPPDP